MPGRRNRAESDGLTLRFPRDQLVDGPRKLHWEGPEGPFGLGHRLFLGFLIHLRQDRDRVILQRLALQEEAKLAPLRQDRATPILWTTNLMAPEAYVLKAAVDGWIRKEDGSGIRARAAKAYNSYQNCGLTSATRLFATGW